MNDHCVRKKLKNSQCDNCAACCPADAVTFGYLDVKIDNDRCFQCGNCLFVCPSDAIEHIPIRERSYNNNGQLVIEKKETPASAEELLVWHRQYHIRGMQIAEPEVDNWLPVLADLNLRLKALGEPIWQLTIIPPPPVDTGKRFALFRQKTVSSGLNTGRARTGLNERKKLWPDDSWFDVRPDTENCILCTACAAVCQEGAITIADNQFTVDKTKCSGCMSCRDVCFPKAIDVIPQAEKNSQPVHYAYFDAHCSSCHLPFMSWQPGQTLCPVCRSRKEKGWL
ncbi:4Fe-4S binding protein [Morganella morganii]|uniref:4Fe-4S binding protein n=1 Tax=Morganella morganii TaxID=582 RepID=UPI00280C83B1|nr:4Fe-4S binding protein [Morganella morganii]MDW7784912.1 4Fe-4S binding protein [Morganella morganii]MDW7792147.1 4Fe-4S binding protein [Morganella morganii]HDU8655477.1 4Fe-4S binding protein [Morganella morganii subsp. morganii]